MVPVDEIDNFFEVLFGVGVVHDYLQSVEPHEGWLIECFNDFHVLTMG
jgi:hypothetical protein